MLSSAKPTTGAFILREDKAKEFFALRENTAQNALKRYELHHKKDSVATPNKK